mmetsp:Transcript_27273/g.69543  ORF Transcript_27273/g.69543 Transcript_27273/m.69543 type:complete len:292 (+) Transcript_27273:219-1094(+)
MPSSSASTSGCLAARNISTAPRTSRRSRRISARRASTRRTPADEMSSPSTSRCVDVVAPARTLPRQSLCRRAGRAWRVDDVGWSRRTARAARWPGTSVAAGRRTGQRCCGRFYRAPRDGRRKPLALPCDAAAPFSARPTPARRADPKVEGAHHDGDAVCGAFRQVPGGIDDTGAARRDGKGHRAAREAVDARAHVFVRFGQGGDGRGDTVRDEGRARHVVLEAPRQGATGRPEQHGRHRPLLARVRRQPQRLPRLDEARVCAPARHPRQLLPFDRCAAQDDDFLGCALCSN